jgi:hypothetical protein
METPILIAFFIILTNMFYQTCMQGDIKRKQQFLIAQKGCEIHKVL